MLNFLRRYRLVIVILILILFGGYALSTMTVDRKSNNNLGLNKKKSSVKENNKKAKSGDSTSKETGLAAKINSQQKKADESQSKSAASSQKSAEKSSEIDEQKSKANDVKIQNADNKLTTNQKVLLVYNYIYEYYHSFDTKNGGNNYNNTVISTWQQSGQLTKQWVSFVTKGDKQQQFMYTKASYLDSDSGPITGYQLFAGTDKISLQNQSSMSFTDDNGKYKIYGDTHLDGKLHNSDIINGVDVDVFKLQDDAKVSQQQLDNVNDQVANMTPEGQ